MGLNFQFRRFTQILRVGRASPKQSFRPPFPKGGRARARCHSRPLGWPLRRRTRPRGFAQAKFSSTFFKRWRIPKAAPLAAIRRWRNAPYFRRIWGFGGLYKRKAPKAPPNSTFPRRQTASPPGRWRAAPEGALARRLAAPSVEGGTFRHCQSLPLWGRVGRGVHLSSPRREF